MSGTSIDYYYFINIIIKINVITTEILIIGRRCHIRPQAIPLAMITMRKVTRFLLVPMSMVLCLVAQSSAIM